MKYLPRAVVFLASVAVALPLWAGQRAVPATVMSTATQNVARAAAGRSLAMIQGTALYADRSPIPYAKLQLRNLDSQRIEQVTSANYTGDFSFLAHPGIPYIVELVDDAGRVLTTGAIVAADAGQTAGALVILPARAMTLAGLFRNTAGALVAAAAGTGITAVTTTGVPQSPEQ